MLNLLDDQLWDGLAEAQDGFAQAQTPGMGTVARGSDDG
jgi:hypothetical protein